MEKNVHLKYRLYRRRNGVFYWQDNDSSKQGTLRTSDRREAERLLNAMNESYREPTLNLNLARAYLAAAKEKKIPYQVASAARGTGTDASPMQLSRGGMATGLLSVPLRYMHTPNELLSLQDLENTARVLAAFCASLSKDQDFTP